jgi:hypothetical protein
MSSSLSHIIETNLPYPVEKWVVTAVGVFEKRRAKVARKVPDPLRCLSIMIVAFFIITLIKNSRIRDSQQLGRPNGAFNGTTPFRASGGPSAVKV